MLALWLSLLLLTATSNVAGNLIGVDFASDSMKIALVQPGKALEIVTNFQSKRKTPVCVAFYKNERLFGSDGTALMGRKPELSYVKLQRMIGRRENHPHVAELKQHFFPYEIYANDSAPSLCVKVEETQYTPEELIALILQNVKEITQSFAGHSVKDCVLTVPAYFTQPERQALYTAAEIADLNVLSLIEENTAAALQYALDRSFDEPTTVLYYNMGAGSVQVSVVSYSSYSVKEGGKNKTVAQFEVVGKAWDSSLGGFNFDIKLADLLAQRFNAVWNKKPSGKDKDLRDFYRPMTRLRIEANKVKEVLSANAEFPIRAEQLHAETDLNTKVTRAEFEEACSDLFSRLTGPIDAALAMANKTIYDLNAVELLGGAVRMPKVKKILDDYFKPSSLVVGQHLNGDEAMALGAAFRAANLSTAFRVRKVGMSDISSFGVAVQLETLPTDQPTGNKNLLSGFFGGKKAEAEEKEAAPEENWSKYTVLYPRQSPMVGKMKTVAFLYDQDISCKIKYDDSIASAPGEDELVAEYNITGVAAFAKEASEKGYGMPKVHLSFVLDASGLASLVKAEATVDLPEVPEAAPPANESAANATASAPANETSANASEAAAPMPAKKAAKKSVLRRVLTVASQPLFPRWSPTQITAAKARLRALAAEDELRRAKAKAMNDLEGYLYKVKNRIYDDEDKLKAVSTEAQRQEILDLCNAVEDWLYDEGRDQPVSAYAGKQKEIQAVAEALFKRFSEVKARADAVVAAKKALHDVRTSVQGWDATLPQVSAEEKQELLALVQAADDWIEEKAELQEKQSPYETPVFDSADVPRRLKPVRSLFEKLLKKPKPAAAPTNASADAAPQDESIRVETTRRRAKAEDAEAKDGETPAKEGTPDQTDAEDEL